MNLVLEGIYLGLTLTILLGPIFIALTQTAIEKGARAGMTVGIGVWSSDFLIISLTYIFIKEIQKITNDYTFTYWMGLLGGFVLIVFGIGIFLKKVEIKNEQQSFSAKNYLGFWTKGFLVNTVNPFTFIFWISVLSSYIIGKKASQGDIIVLISAVMFTIIFTDSAKVLLSKGIRNKLKAKHIQWFSRVAGVGLIIFGFILLYRSDVI